MLGHATDPGDLVEQVLTTLSEVFLADVTCVASVYGQRLVVTGSCGLAEDDPALTAGVPLGACAAQALATGRAVSRTGAISPEELPASVAALGVASAVWVPLDIDGPDSGVLLLCRRHPQPFDQSDLAVLGSVAYRLRLAVRERERAIIMERLATCGHQLTRHLDLEPLLAEAVELLHRLTNADRSWIVTLEGGQARLRAQRGLPASALADWPRSVGTLAREISTWPPAGVNRSTSPAGPASPDPGPQGGPVLRVPVHLDGGPAAVLFAARDRPWPFSQETHDVTAIFASQLGVAMANARLCQALQLGATHDALTGLGNRTLVSQRLAESLRQPAGTGHIGLLFCDLDGFKAVNDRLGHETGDDLLRLVAERLRRSIRPGDLLARFGGDEFVIVIDGVNDLAEVSRVGWRVVRALDEAFPLRGELVRVSVSVGGVLGVRGRSTPSTMLRDADAAMYAAKERGPGLIEVFDEVASTRSLERLDVRSELLHALERNELQVYYQPIVELDSGRILSFEALLRWTHQRRGAIAPEEFIPHAEQTGAIVAIGQWVLAQACRQLARWQRQLGRTVRISVNVSAAQLRQPHLVGQMLQTIRESGVRPDDVWLEITEHSYARDDVSASATALHTAGVRFALDDFGTAYSNLNYLKRFPFEMIKIDRSFVHGVDHNDTDRGIVRAIVAIADSLGLRAVAEGIETAQQRAAVRALGCELGQGYLLHPPVCAERATLLLAGNGAPDGDRPARRDPTR